MIHGYPRHPSVRPGETLTLHVSTDDPHFRVDVYRQGARLEPMGRLGPERLPGHAVPPGPARSRLGLARVRLPDSGRLALGRLHRDADRDRRGGPRPRSRRHHAGRHRGQGAVRRAQPGAGRVDLDPVQARVGDVSRLQRDGLREPLHGGGLDGRRRRAGLHGDHASARWRHGGRRHVRRLARLLRPDQPPPDLHALGSAVRGLARGERLPRRLRDRLGPPGGSRAPDALRPDAERGARRVLERRDARPHRGVHPGAAATSRSSAATSAATASTSATGTPPSPAPRCARRARTGGPGRPITGRTCAPRTA